eukprot:c39096_g1_i1 orf=3-197(-)
MPFVNTLRYYLSLSPVLLTINLNRFRPMPVAENVQHTINHLTHGPQKPTRVPSKSQLLTITKLVR